MKKINKIIGSVLVSTFILSPMLVNALEKKETVYTNLDYTGTPYKTIVNNHLYIDSKDEIEDETELKDILNINGEEKFKLNDNKILWESSGKDIFYQGTTDKKLPIEVNVKYYLNDEEKSVKEIIGKKGNIKIELEFTNNSYIIKGSKKIYTPIVATIGTIINDEDNSNIEITNGKAIDTGTKNILVGIASPGLYESTSLEELEDLDKITITYETTKFSLNNIYIVATPKLLEESDFNIFDKADKLSSSVNTIQENMNKIENGAKELENGANTLANGANEISINLRNAYNGILKLENGSTSVSNGINQVIDALNLAKSQLDTSSLTMLKDTNYASANKLITSLKSQGLTDEIITLFNQFTVSNLGVGGTFNSSDEANSALQQYLINAGKSQVEIQAVIQSKSLYDVYLLLNSNGYAFDQTSQKINILSSKIDELLIGLDNLKSGSIELSNGIKTIKGGIYQLYNGSVKLNEGANSLNNGTSTLSDGISTLNKEGINKLTDYSNKFKNYSNKAKELVELSKEYNGFGSNNADNTIFIYKMKAAK